MAKMKVAEIQKTVKDNALNVLIGAFENYTQIGNHEISVPYMVDGQERYAKISVVCGQLSDTKTSKAFNPQDAHEEWVADCEFKEKVKAEKEKAKAEKLAKKGVKE